MTAQPDAGGHFGPYGGRYVPEVLMAPIEELERAYLAARAGPGVSSRAGDSAAHLRRPAHAALLRAQRLERNLGGARIWLKREDLLHTGAHKINNCLGQALLARRMGKRRIIAETGAGQHGVATATVCALLGFECVVYMGEEDMRRQRLNVFRMRLLGAQVVGVASGSRTLKDAISEAMRDWVTNVGDTHYLLGSALGAHPYPMMVRDFHKVIGEEARRADSGSRRPPAGCHLRLRGRRLERHRHLPRVPGGCRRASWSASKPADAATAWASMRRAFAAARPACCKARTAIVLQDDDGQIALTHSVSAGLDYAMIGPEHAWLHDQRRAEYVAASDAEALEAARLLSRTEGIIPALESAHAVAEAVRRAPAAKGQIFLVNLSGRGDKDIDIYRENFRSSTRHDAHRLPVRTAETRGPQGPDRLSHGGRSVARRARRRWWKRWCAAARI